MPYTPKPGTPASFNLADAAGALITGDPDWGWMLGWLPIIGNPEIPTAAFCAAGPSGMDGVDPAVFLPVAGRTPVQTALNIAQRIFTVQAWARDRVFGAFCEIADPDAFTCTLIGTYTLTAGQADVYLPPASGALNGPYTHSVIRRSPGSHAAFDFDAFNYNAAGTVNLGSFSSGTFSDAQPTHSEAAFIAGSEYYLWRVHNVLTGGSIELYECNAGGFAPYEPDAPVQPTGALPPVTRDYPDLPSIGRELDAQELKLDTLMGMVRFLTEQVGLPPAPPTGDPIAVVEGEPIQVGDAIGAIVAVSTIPSWADEHFGNPAQLARIGRVTVGSAQGWQPSHELEHSPMLVLFPKGITQIAVNTSPYVSATVQLLYAYK